MQSLVTFFEHEISRLFSKHEDLSLSGERIPFKIKMEALNEFIHRETNAINAIGLQIMDADHSITRTFLQQILNQKLIALFHLNVY